MPTLVRDPQPAEFEAMLERRRQLGQDLFARNTARSRLIGLGASELAELIEWP